jgi:hypothetical protein
MDYQPIALMNYYFPRQTHQQRGSNLRKCFHGLATLEQGMEYIFEINCRLEFTLRGEGLYKST